MHRLPSQTSFITFLVAAKALKNNSRPENKPITWPVALNPENSPNLSELQVWHVSAAGGRKGIAQAQLWWFYTAVF